MRIFRIFLITFFGILGIFAVQDTFADCNGWFNFSSQCDIVPPYCQDGKCTLSGGLDVTKKVIGDNLTAKPISQYVQDVVRYLLGFVSIIAVIYVIYAGFQLMIGGGDEEKMKKARQIIIYVIGGIVLMWLAYAIVSIVIETISKTAGPTTTQQSSYKSWMIPGANAAYTENDSDTFREYQNKLRIAIQNLESEFKINNSVNISNVQNIKSLVQAAFERLPDVGSDGVENDTAKRSVDTYLELAIKNPSSNTHVSNAISKVAAFIDGAKISTITGDITATPVEGNAPLTVSFRASNIKDPSGTTPDPMQYIWWMRGNGGTRRELGRGPNLVYTFTSEGTYTVFLDVVSGSRNSKGRIDVLPLSVSKQIEVKPRLGEVVLLLNGVNVSSLSSIKMNPAIGKMGIILDATASRATGGSITDTIWDFGNENTISYRGGPIVERQIYSNQGNYTIKLSLKTNDGQTFNKEIQLVVRDPSAVIQTEKETGYIGSEMHFSALSYFTNASNVEYSWQIQDENNKKVLASGAGTSIKFTFPSVGKYIVSLTARSPNGNVDSDSRVITIESRDPVVNLETPKSISTEKPNTFIFDARKSYDPDTMAKNSLTYTWRLDGQKIELANTKDNGAYGELTFDDTGKHTISVTVANAYGKVASGEKSFEVESTLAVNMLITPSVAPIGTIVNFIGQAPNGDFFEWNMGDGSALQSGNKKVVQNIYQRTGVYDVTLNVRTAKGEMKNQVSRKVYVTDANSPFALITVSNSTSSVYEDKNACGGKGAMVINRSEATTLDGSKSLNVDGTTSDLSYTWNYFGKVKTTSSLSEKFTDIGCFPIKLTVRSNKTGATHTSTQYVSIKNTPPEITSISTNIDSSKKDSQKVLVKVTANGARDVDGVITSYIWYYTTESDKEPQNIQITQKSDITFVLPNITEKYYFGVILEDNDGARTNSMGEGTEQTPLILDNQNGNIYMPLISLSTPKNSILAGEKIFLSAEAKTIVGTNITKNAEYAWDFDGDGKIDERSTTSSIEHVYKNSGTYNLKVRVTYNGVSNTKYTTVYVKNALKAKAIGYQLANGDISLVNISSGPYDKALWNINNESTESLYGLTLPQASIGTSGTGILGKLTVTSNDSDISTTDISWSDVTKITPNASGVTYQSFPKAENDTIHVASQTDRVFLSLYGNSTVSEYAIDSDTRIDSDLDGIGDNDKDNKDTPSFTDGSLYVISDFTHTQVKEREVKITLFQGGVPVSSKTIKLIFDFIKTDTTVSGEPNIGTNSGGMSTFERTKLDALAELLRATDGTDRIMLMKEYNTLIENWDDPFSRTKSLINLQELIDASTVPADKKAAMTSEIDALLVGGAASTDEITLATTVIEGLITTSQNKAAISEKLQEIAAHPNALETNKTLAKEILELVKNDPSLEDKYKIHIKNQLLIVLNGGQASIPSSEVSTDSGASSSILGFIGAVVKIFFFILGIILLVVLIGYIFYRVSRKNDDIGFQDFLIDSVFHTRRAKPETPKTEDGTNLIIKTEAPKVDPLQVSETEKTPTPSWNEDPLKTFSVPESTKVDPLSEGSLNTTNTAVTDEVTMTAEETSVPDWLKAPVSPETPKTEDSKKDIVLSDTSTSETQEKTTLLVEPTPQELTSVPDWLKVPSLHEETKESIPEEMPKSGTENDILSPISLSDDISLVDEVVPKETVLPAEKDISEKDPSPLPASDTLPDWLIESAKPVEETKEQNTKAAPMEKEGKPKKEEIKKGKAKGEKEIKKETAPKPKTETKNNTQESSSDASLPDWLK